MAATTLNVKLSGGYQFAQIERLIRDLHPLAALDEPRVVRLDMGGLVFIGPSGLALLAACVRRAADENLLLPGSLMTRPRSKLTSNYLMRMDLFAHLAGVEVDEPFARKAPMGFRPCSRTTRSTYA